MTAYEGWREMEDGSWMSTYWDVLRDDHDPRMWRLWFYCGKRPLRPMFNSPQQAMRFSNHDDNELEFQ
jgi:hypothetical protein